MSCATYIRPVALLQCTQRYFQDTAAVLDGTTTLDTPVQVTIQADAERGPV